MRNRHRLSDTPYRLHLQRRLTSRYVAKDSGALISESTNKQLWRFEVPSAFIFDACHASQINIHFWHWQLKLIICICLDTDLVKCLGILKTKNYFLTHLSYSEAVPMTEQCLWPSILNNHKKSVDCRDLIKLWRNLTTPQRGLLILAH